MALNVKAAETDRGARLVAFLEQDARPRLPAGVRGSRTTKEQVEEILGFGPEGV